MFYFSIVYYDDVGSGHAYSNQGKSLAPLALTDSPVLERFFGLMVSRQHYPLRMGVNAVILSFLFSTCRSAQGHQAGILLMNSVVR